MLDDLGLRAAIDWYLRGFSRRHDIRVELLHDRMDERLASETEATAFRIVQEALTNIAKHAHATSCRIYLQRLTNTVLITIEDDGTGFDVADAAPTSPRRGLGLLGIRERVAQLRGTLRLESSPSEGHASHGGAAGADAPRYRRHDRSRRRRGRGDSRSRSVRWVSCASSSPTITPLSGRDYVRSSRPNPNGQSWRRRVMAAKPSGRRCCCSLTSRFWTSACRD